ncbi:aldo/keto reductase [Mucilaginibacter sp.]
MAGKITTHRFKIMEYTVFGSKSGLRVAEYGLGTANFGTGWGHGSDFQGAEEIFDAYLNAGGNLIDTGDSYQFGQSEQILGELISAERLNLVVSTKYTFGSEKQGGILRSGNSRKNMIQAVEASLKRLKTDYIDIYWAHLSDGQTPIEEILRGFDDLVRAGKILYSGFSNFPAWRISAASQIATLKELAPVTGIQIEYSLMERSADRELLPMAESLGLGVAFWSPLAGGTLTGKYRQNSEDPNTRLATIGVVIRKEDSEKQTLILDTVSKIADELGVTMLDVALAWVRQKHDQSFLSTVTILGPRTVQQLTDNLASLNVSLSADQMTELNDISALKLGYPYDLINGAQKRIFGATDERVILKHPVI